MPLMNSRFGACAAKAAVAISPVRFDDEIAPVADGKNLLKTTPFWATMKKLKTGAALAAQADRSGSPSRNGRPMATVPAPFRKLRRFTRGPFGVRPMIPSALDFTVHLRDGS